MSKKRSYPLDVLRKIASGYDTRKAFSDGDHAAYAYACKHKLLDDICQHMPCNYKRKKASNTFYSDDDLFRIGRGYKSRADFERGDNNAYHTALNRGLMDAIFEGVPHADPWYKYSDDDLRRIASGFHFRNEFCEQEHGAYQAARDRGILDDICQHMPKNAHELEMLPRDEVFAAARQSKSRSDFNKHFSGPVHRAKKDGYYDELEATMVKEGVWQPKRIRTKEEAMAIAKNYDTRKDFLECDLKTYRYCYYHGFLDEACAHMKPLGNHWWRMVYAFEFSDGCAYVGLTYNLNVRLNHHLYSRSAVRTHIQETGATYVLKELTGWIGADTVGQVEEHFIEKYRSEGWTMLNQVKGGSLGHWKRHKKKKDGQ